MPAPPDDLKKDPHKGLHDELAHPGGRPAGDDSGGAGHTETTSGEEHAAAGASASGHWLYRLSAEEWLAAAANELLSAQAAFRAKQQRAAVTYARRAGGMALNAVLRLSPEPDPRYGRSYMEHIQALATDEREDAGLREAAERLLRLPTRLELVPLGPGDVRQAEPALRLLEHARARIEAARPARG